MSLPFAGIVVVWSGDKPRHDVYRIGERFVLGRDIVDRSDDRISRQHTAFSVLDSRIHVADCNSRNGTYLERSPLDLAGLQPGLPAIVRSGRTLTVAIADVRPYEHVPISRRGSVVVAGSLDKQVRAVDLAALAEENVMLFGALSIGRELAVGYATKLAGTHVVIDTATITIARALDGVAAMRTIIVIVTGPIAAADWQALAPWLETDVRFVFVMRHETQAIGMPTELAQRLAGTIISIPRLRFDELPTTLYETFRARFADGHLHASAIEAALVRARAIDEDQLLASFRAGLDRWDRQGAFRDEHFC
jgi:FHA domain